MSAAPSSSGSVSSETASELDYVLQRYEVIIDYYWQASRRNKRNYKWSRYATIILSAIVTLIASLSSAKFVAENNLSTAFGIVTPSLAAMLTIVTGFSQTFQWGAAWRDMVLNAEKIQGELDRMRVLPKDKRDPVAELKALNDLVETESNEFFLRVVGGARPTDGNGGPVGSTQSNA